MGYRELKESYLLISQLPVNCPMTFEMPLPVRHLTLNHRNRDIRVRPRGDEVIAMESFDADLTFFDPLE